MEFAMRFNPAPVLGSVSDFVRAEPNSGEQQRPPMTRARDVVSTATPIGASAQWRAVLKLARQVAATETTACLQGESGTGKEVVARFIHAMSARRLGAFVGINCAALPDGLLESELFGYERGAFTGAQQTKPGHVELASGGVLFLDEITEMPLPAQAKLLRILQEREFFRLGGTRPMKMNVRVIAAANQDLASAVSQGRFREDLYYRINVFDIRIPPLRERGRDVLLLAESFLEHSARTNGGVQRQLTERAEGSLLAHHWPGNVRELRNVLERAAIVCEGPCIDAEHLSLVRRTDVPSLNITDLNTLERHAIQQVLREVDGNKARAAERLGISRTQLYTRVRKHGLQPRECQSA
jgi:Nif-specific regulatory protein